MREILHNTRFTLTIGKKRDVIKVQYGFLYHWNIQGTIDSQFHSMECIKQVCSVIKSSCVCMYLCFAHWV